MPDHIAPILAAWWGTVQRHAERHLTDRDPKHIHRFRTHLRRLRSVLSRLEPALPPVLDRKFLRRLRTVAKQTNALRDLDVVLACEQHWLALLPPELVPGGREVCRELHAERRRARKLADAYLSGKRFARQRAAITTHLSSLADVDPDALARRMAQTLCRQYERMALTQRKLTAASSSRKWHRLRIRAKSLRYCLEACPPDPAQRELLTALKQLQVQLGDLNDLTVQQALLTRLAENDWTPLGLQAIGAWRRRLHVAQQEVRPGLPGALAAFCCPAAEQMLLTLAASLR